MHTLHPLRSAAVCALILATTLVRAQYGGGVGRGDHSVRATFYVDCNGAQGGAAYVDNCGVCVGGDTGLEPCTLDCAGAYGGAAFYDQCGVCVGGSTGLSACGGSIYSGGVGRGDAGVRHWLYIDCAGVPGGGAQYDACGVCVGGTTGLLACVQDCNGLYGGTAAYDACGVCAGGTTGIAPCAGTIYSGGTGRGDAGVRQWFYTDCAGVPGGAARVDNCGLCSGGTTGLPPCTADCAGVWGGSASYDGCGVCSGGSTGMIACNGSIYVGGEGRGDISATFIIGADLVQVSARVLLDGPYAASTGLMNDDLRVLGYLPTAQPYGGAPYYYAGTETIQPEQLLDWSENAPVDWLLLELRDAAMPASVVARRAALLQRDGDIVDVNGGPVRFDGMAPGNYHLAVRHRNHLGIMSGIPLMIGGPPVAIDFSQPATATFGVQARRAVNGVTSVMTLWSGDVSADGQLKYTGANNDRDPILVTIGGTVPTNTMLGYLPADVNLDGVVKYTGANNDRDPILVNIGGTVPTNVRLQQLP